MKILFVGFAICFLAFLGCESSVSIPNLQGERSTNQALSGKRNEKPGLASVFRQLAIIQDKSLNEISGMAASSDGRGVWVLNDSGGEDEIYLVGPEGKLLQTVEIKGAKQRDWEDLASFQAGGRNYLLIAESGNNRLIDRPAVLYIVAEPEKSDRAKPAKVLLEIRVSFPEQPYDCESVAVVGSMIVLATKASPLRPTAPESYLFSVSLPDLRKKESTVEVTAEKIGVGPLRLATAMDVSHDGKRLIIRDYLTMALYQREDQEDWMTVLKKKPVAKFPGPFQKQAEAVCFSLDDKRLWTISEGTHPTWWSAELTSHAK